MNCIFIVQLYFNNKNVYYVIWLLNVLNILQWYAFVWRSSMVVRVECQAQWHCVCVKARLSDTVSVWRSVSVLVTVCLNGLLPAADCWRHVQSLLSEHLTAGHSPLQECSGWLVQGEAVVRYPGPFIVVVFAIKAAPLDGLGEAPLVLLL